MSQKNKIYTQYLFFGFLIVLSSWLRWIWTGSLEADDNSLPKSGFKVWAFFLCYSIGFSGWLYTYIKIVFQSEKYILSKIETKNLSYITIGLFSFMSVLFASDIYTYLAEGELATRGIFTYTNGELVKQSRFIDFVSPWWKECPNHYGPPLLFLFYTSVLIGKSVLGSYIVFKILMTLTTIAAIHFIYKLIELNSEKTKFNLFGFIALSPLIMIEGVGQAHVEIFITLLLILTIYSFLNQKFIWSIIFISLAMSCKIMYSMVLLPFILALFFVKFINKEKSILKFISYSLLTLILSSSIVAMTYIPVWEGIQTILYPMDYHKTKTPSRSFTEIFILIYHYGGELISSNFSISGLIAKTHDSQFLTKEMVLNYQNKIAPIFKYLGIILAGFSMLPLLKTKKTTEVFHIFAKVWIIIITIYSPIFNPWYYIPILFLMYYTDVKSWIIYAIIAMSMTMNPQLSNSIPSGYLPEILLSINLLCFPIFFLIYFKKNMILETIEKWKNPN